MHANVVLCTVQSTLRIENVRMHDRPSPTFPTKPLNEHYKTDIKYTFQICQWFLKPLGVYPFIYSGTSKLVRIISAFLILLCFLVLQFVAVPVGHYILYYQKGLRARIETIGPFIFITSMTFRYGFIGMKGPAIKRCVEFVERDWEILENQDQRAILTKHVTTAKNLIRLCAAALYIGGIFYNTVMPLLSDKRIQNATVRHLSYPGYEAFFDVQRSPTYEIIMGLHCVYVVIAANIVMSTYSFTAIFVYHICGQVEIQTSRLENLTKQAKMGEKSEYREDCLSTVVKRHVDILRFAKAVEEALCEICLLEVLLSVILICFVLYLFILEWETDDSIAILTYIILTVSFIFNILIFCYVGELLLGQGSKIASASYGIEWYDLPVRKARDIVMLIATSKNPPKLTAGKIIVLSLNTFTVVMKSSVAYFNLLRTAIEL